MQATNTKETEKTKPPGQDKPRGNSPRPAFTPPPKNAIREVRAGIFVGGSPKRVWVDFAKPPDPHSEEEGSASETQIMRQCI